MRWAYWWLICNHLGQVVGVLSQRIPFQGSVALWFGDDVLYLNVLENNARSEERRVGKECW